MPRMATTLRHVFYLDIPALKQLRKFLMLRRQPALAQTVVAHGIGQILGVRAALGNI